MGSTDTHTFEFRLEGAKIFRWGTLRPIGDQGIAQALRLPSPVAISPLALNFDDRVAIQWLLLPLRDVVSWDRPFQDEYYGFATRLEQAANVTYRLLSVQAERFSGQSRCCFAPVFACSEPAPDLVDIVTPPPSHAATPFRSSS